MGKERLKIVLNLRSVRGKNVIDVTDEFKNFLIL